VLTAGVVRVLAGAKPVDFYVENPVFWLKLATILAIGLLSIVPTARYARWRNAAAAPALAELAAVRRLVTTQLALFPLIPVCAALMARGIGA